MHLICKYSIFIWKVKNFQIYSSQNLWFSGQFLVALVITVFAGVHCNVCSYLCRVISALMNVSLLTISSANRFLISVWTFFWQLKFLSQAATLEGIVATRSAICVSASVGWYVFHHALTDRLSAVCQSSL